jgi:very-short-patch-repair endonuclease
MGHQDALRDGIRFSGEYGAQYYYPPCSQCGDEARSWGYNPEHKYICAKCKEINRVKRSQERKSKELNKSKFVKDKTEIVKAKETSRMSRALERISKVTDIAKYTQAIEKVQVSINAGAVFDSTEELLVGLELTRQGVAYRQQVRFGKYRADFVLDSYKIVLEVDGRVFHTRETKPREQERDGCILSELGPGWEVVRVTDDNINNHITQITKAITKVLEYRKLMKARAIAYRHNTQPV